MIHLFILKNRIRKICQNHIFRFSLVLLSLFCCTGLHAQTDSIGTVPAKDSLSAHLNEVIIHAYQSNHDIMQVAAPVAVINAGELSRFNPQSAVQVVNAIPGVRIDERSPASYRLNIRGSSMRSPFGVRNVKVYYHDLPYTEPGGTTYLNQLGLMNFSGAEIIKGPGSSMYGSGTGGVMLLGMETATSSGVNIGYSYGSYRTHTASADVHVRHKNAEQKVMYQQNSGDGYREQSASRRKIFNWDGIYRLGRYYELNHVFLFGDLYYQTPGALTLKEFLADPHASRPAVGNFPSAIQANAAIWQKTAMSGINLKSDWRNGLSNTTGIYTAYTGLDNATIRNYSYTMQPHSGGRTVFSFVQNMKEIVLKFDAGAELQAGTSFVDVYNNESGMPGDVQSAATIRTVQWFSFLQASTKWHNWELLMGTSLNNINLNYSSSIPAAIEETRRSFSSILSPRISLSKSVRENMFLYASVSKGFSPPVTDELLPSGSSFNNALQPEQGVNYEVGLRYKLPGKLALELNGYYFRLDQTIVQRRDAGGGDFYINAGNTIQPGVEASAVWMGGRKNEWTWRVNMSYAYQPYIYGTFMKEQDDYSGNALPGLAMHNIYLGLQTELLRHIVFVANYFYNSRMPLNDLNSDYGSEVHALSGKIGWQCSTGSYRIKLMAGAENILDKAFSLGYDINAAGGRYYNAAPGRNYFLQLLFSK